ncbi:MAG: HD domain-containing protein [Flavobacterium sp.]|nr:MAG: HD domain-containing protein [Flavobacterium sp.]
MGCRFSIFEQILKVASNKLKILNDPIYGFISLPDELIYDLVNHPYFQRLRRISQMGLSSLVFPGAQHTRFHHALGSMHLMQKAVDVLRSKGTAISPEEEQALYVAILLHDIGHGPFSHAMENSIAENVHHESISLLFMQRLNTLFSGKLELAIEIFTGNYPRKFMLQLVSSQLDMDRMDYLKRDSFFTGVAEGNINSDRLIQMLHVVDDVLMIEEKAIYSVEKFLMARRLMYWQAYLHKTSLSAELMLMKVLKRARELVRKEVNVEASAPLQFFIQNKITTADFDDATLDRFAQLDDYDIISALKQWQFHSDPILSDLSRMVINRDLLKIRLDAEKFPAGELARLVEIFTASNGMTPAEAKYYIFKGKIRNQAYSNELEPIRILRRDGTVGDVIEASDQMNLKALSKPVIKYYMCFPKQLSEK